MNRLVLYLRKCLRYEIRPGDGHIVVRLADGEASCAPVTEVETSASLAGPKGRKRCRQIATVLGMWLLAVWKCRVARPGHVWKLLMSEPTVSGARGFQMCPHASPGLHSFNPASITRGDTFFESYWFGQQCGEAQGCCGVLRCLACQHQTRVVLLKACQRRIDLDRFGAPLNGF